MDQLRYLERQFALGLRGPCFPDFLVPDEYGLIALGGELSVPLLLEAYAKGHFPWSGEHPIPWYSPDPRLVLFPNDFRASRSLKKLVRKGRYTIRFDHNFQEVMQQCAKTPRPGQKGTWINGDMFRVYGQLHELHVAHSVEVYEGETLCGGLYGLTLGKCFFGESMFHQSPNASKLAIYALSKALQKRKFDLIDCQQETPHMKSLGAVAISRREYLNRLRYSLRNESAHHSWVSWSDDLLTDE